MRLGVRIFYFSDKFQHKKRHYENHKGGGNATFKLPFPRGADGGRVPAPAGNFEQKPRGNNARQQRDCRIPKSDHYNGAPFRQRRIGGRRDLRRLVPVSARERGSSKPAALKKLLDVGPGKRKGICSHACRARRKAKGKNSSRTPWWPRKPREPDRAQKPPGSTRLLWTPRPP